MHAETAKEMGWACSKNVRQQTDQEVHIMATKEGEMMKMTTKQKMAG